MTDTTDTTDTTVKITPVAQRGIFARAAGKPGKLSYEIECAGYKKEFDHYVEAVEYAPEFREMVEARLEEDAYFERQIADGEDFEG